MSPPSPRRLQEEGRPGQYCLPPSYIPLPLPAAGPGIPAWWCLVGLRLEGTARLGPRFAAGARKGSEGSPQNPRVLKEVLFVLQKMMFFSFCEICVAWVPLSSLQRSAEAQQLVLQALTAQVQGNEQKEERGYGYCHSWS
ncbi:unnamed protein product [Coccothraustes coccothraustes]